MSGSYVLTPVVIHELGHNLGLFHTLHGTFPEGGGSQCPELVNRSNSSICGDYVTDTPADPRIWSGCTYVGTVKDANGQAYNPLTDNYMSYVAPSCLISHTPLQIARIHTYIKNSSILQATTVRLAGPESICPSGVFSILNPLSTTATWSVSPATGAVSITGSGNSRTLTRIGTFAGFVTLTVTVSTPCGSRNLTQKVYVGTPNSNELSVFTETNSVNKNVPFPFVASYPSRCDLSNAEWEVSPSGSNNIQYNAGFPCINGNNTGVTISFSTAGSKQIRVRVQNSCGWSGWSPWKTITVN